VTLSEPFTVGGLRCHTLEGGRQRLDGGAMFGVVPRPLWMRRATPDDRNRIPLALRCLLVEHPDGLALIDTGLGNKEDPKFQDIYGVENAGDPGPTRIEDAIREAGFDPVDVRWVINTHLHFDHAGGNTSRGEDGGLRLAWPKATHVVHKGELAFARAPNERTRASYLPDNFEPVAAADRWRLLEREDEEILPGIRARATPGHVPWHRSIVIEDGGETAVFLGDVIPTTAHLPLPWIMGYDLEPLRTLESKRALLADAAAGGWLLVFEHDPAIARARVERAGRDVVLIEPAPAPTPATAG